MLNVQELERQWFRYKLKSYIPKVIILIILLTLSIFIIIFTLNSDIIVDSSSTLSNTPKVETLIAKKQIDTKSSLLLKTPQKIVSTKKKPTNQKMLTLQPSLEFINSLKYMPEEPIQKPQTKTLIQKPTVTKKPELEVVEHKNIEPIIEKNIQTEIENIAPNRVTKEEKLPPNFTINVRQEAADIQDVINRFHNTKKPALSLFIAKRFYAMKEYTKAYNYALITNGLNSNIEESWLIAARSLSKLNQKDKAITLLTQFIDDTKSIEAIMLLEQIKDNTL